MQDALRIYGERLNRHGTVFIMDGDKGGRAAVRSVWSEDVLFFNCSNHLGANMLKISSRDQRLYRKAALSARSREEVDELVKQMSEKAQKKLTIDLKLEEWSLICSGRNYGNHTSNISEGAHAALVDGRKLSMIGDDSQIVNSHNGILCFCVI